MTIEYIVSYGLSKRVMVGLMQDFTLKWRVAV